MHFLKFSKANAKLVALEKATGRKVYSFDTLSGVTCIYADKCRSQVTYKGDGKFGILDGPNMEFRCFSASQEVIFPAVREQRLQNTGLGEVAARSVNEAVETILYQLPHDIGILRLHVSGDSPSQNYFDAWLEVARQSPNVHFYAYTKALPFWVKRLGMIPQNFRLTASYGGYRDDLIEKFGLRYSKVVYSALEAENLGLQIDHTDELAYNNGPSFALIIHGQQPPQSRGSEAIKAMKKSGTKFSYGRKDKNEKLVSIG